MQPFDFQNKTFSAFEPVARKVKSNGEFERCRITGENGEIVAGVYIFWWTGDRERLETGSNLKIKIKGKEIKKSLRQKYEDSGGDYLERGDKKFIVYHHEWKVDDQLYKKYGNRVPLYVGKTTTLDQRMQQQLLNGTVDYGKIVDQEGFIIKKTTACQLRSHLEYIFQHEPDPVKRLSYLIDHVEVCHLKTGLSNFGERFYLENHLIGYLKPWFNVDSER